MMSFYKNKKIVNLNMRIQNMTKFLWKLIRKITCFRKYIKNYEKKRFYKLHSKEKNIFINLFTIE